MTPCPALAVGRRGVARRAGLAACVVALALAGGCKSGGGDDDGEAEVKASALVETAAVERGSIEDTLEAYGNVEPAPDATVPVSFPLEASVGRLLVRAGQVVKAGEVVAEVRPSSSVRLDAEKARIDVDYAARDVKRLRGQRDKGLATNADVAQAESALDKAKAEAAAFDGSTRTRTVRAPAAGLVRTTIAKPGDVVAPGSPLVLLAVEGAQRARLGVEARDVGRLAAGGDVHLAALYDDAVAADGKIVQVHPQVDPETHQAAVVVALASAPFVEGAAVRGRIVVRRIEGALLVPRRSVTGAAPPRAVFVVGGDKVRRVEVKVLVDDGVRVAVAPTGAGLHELHEGARVVTTGAAELDDGAAVHTAATGARPTTPGTAP